MIWIIGKGGQVGTALQNLLTNADFTITHESEVDVCNKEAIQNYINEHKPTIILNASAYTAVDKAEVEVDLSYKINYEGVKNLVDCANADDIKLIHISTDYVFDGSNNIAYNEEDIGHPLNVYGKSKLQGDEYILNNAKTAIIFRTGWLYDATSPNFVTTIQRLGKTRKELKVVSDQIGTPTYVYDLAKTIVKFLPHMQIGVSELYNYANEGVASWYDFAHAIMDLSNIDCTVLPIKTKDYPTPATRPIFGVLNKDKIRSKLNLHIPHWRSALKQAIITQDIIHTHE